MGEDYQQCACAVNLAHWPRRHVPLDLRSLRLQRPRRANSSAAPDLRAIAGSSVAATGGRGIGCGMSPAPSAQRPAPAEPSYAERLTLSLAHWSGSTWGFGLGALFMTAWLLTGPLAVDWEPASRLLEQLIVGSTFLLVFVLQRSQNKDTMALQLKLDELVASDPRASNRVLKAEEIPEDELRRIHEHFRLLERLARESGTASQLNRDDALRRHAEEQERQAERGGVVSAVRTVGGGPPASAV
jgi:low affinity Fe/Cu permease